MPPSSQDHLLQVEPSYGWVTLVILASKQKASRKQLTVSVTSEKYDFLVELSNNLELISIDEFPLISEEQKNLVRDRKATATLDSLENWDELTSS